jgi:hypothetical protein
MTVDPVWLDIVHLIGIQFGSQLIPQLSASSLNYTGASSLNYTGASSLNYTGASSLDQPPRCKYNGLCWTPCG